MLYGTKAANFFKPTRRKRRRPDMKLPVSFLCVVAAAALSFSAHAQSVKPDVAKGAATYGQVCVACHAADGNSVIPENPMLAQQHPEYLVKQLQEFKSGKRNNAVMKGFAAALSDDDMRNISYWVASKPAKAGFAKDKDLVALGERIYRGGIADRKVAACAGCHAPNGAGIPAQYPRLAGQHADYTEAQLKTFRVGERANDPAKIRSEQVSQNTVAGTGPEGVPGATSSSPVDRIATRGTAPQIRSPAPSAPTRSRWR